MQEERKKVTNRLTFVTIVANVFLATFKFFAGIVGNSSAMVSDAIHSLSDIFTTVVAYFGVKMASRQADEGHPYGHERIESVAGLALGTLLLITGLGIGIEGCRKIFEVLNSPVETQLPTAIALVGACVSIVIKEAMFWYTRYYAKKINSTAFMADAWHHRTDAISSVAALLGIAASLLGFAIFDSVASIIICIFIIFVALKMMSGALDQVLDASAGKTLESEIRTFVEKQCGVKSVDVLKTRMMGNRICVDLEIGVEGSLTLFEAHKIAEDVRIKIVKNFKDIKFVTIHENPVSSDEN